MIERIFELSGWWLLLAVLASLLSAAAYPLFRRWISAAGPSRRSLFRLLFVSAAPVVSCLVLILVSRPSIAGFLIPEHCHVGLCGEHAPVYAEGSLPLLALASLSGLVFLLLSGLLLWAIFRGRRQLQALTAFSEGSTAGYQTLDSAEPLAACVGIFKPQIIITRGLLESLNSDELRIVLAHEQAHVTRLDNLRNLLVHWATLFWPVRQRQRARQDSRDDAEQAGDLEAARTVAGPGQVAAVILRMTQLSRSCPAGEQRSGSGFDCSDAQLRLEKLRLANSQETVELAASFKALFLLLSLWCVQLYTLTFASHWVIEWLGSALT